MSNPYNKITVNVDGVQYDMADFQALHDRNKILWNNVKALTEENSKLREASTKISELQRLLTLTNEEADEQIEQLKSENSKLREAYQELDDNYNDLTDEYEQTREILFEKSEALNHIYSIAENFAIIS